MNFYNYYLKKIHRLNEITRYNCIISFWIKFKEVRRGHIIRGSIRRVSEGAWIFHDNVPHKKIMKCGLIIPSCASRRVASRREGALSIAFAVGWSTNQRSRCLLRLLKSSKLQTPQRVNYPTDCLWLGAALPSLAREQTWIKNERIINREREVRRGKEAFCLRGIVRVKSWIARLIGKWCIQKSN